MRQQLVAKQIQNLSLTPEIKQSLRFLGLNTVDLLEELKSIALENPLIDIEETSEPQAEQETAAETNESNRLSDLSLEILNHHDVHRMSPPGGRLPCYDFTPVTSTTLGAPLRKVKVTTLGVTNFHGVTGGVYKARERIHRRIADRRLLAIPTSCRRVAACNLN